MVSIKHLLEKRRGAGGARGGSSGGGGGGRGGGGSSSSGGSSSGGSRGGGSSSSGSSSKGGSSSGASNRGGLPGYSPSTSTFGGGVPRTIPVGGAFAGRQFGGATRSSIYSGYGYGGGYGTYARGAALGGIAGYGYGRVAGLGFPFGFWPLYYGPHYYGDDEYGPHSNSSRPGGPLAAASFSPPGGNNSAPPQYMVYGDQDSVGNVTQALASQCQAVAVVGSTPVTDNGTYPSSTNTTLLPALDPINVESYYRASSFALYSFFTDSAQQGQNATTNYTEPISTPPFKYDASLRDRSFESCVNDTISASLPIEDGYQGDSSAATALCRKGARGQAWVATLAAVLVLSGARWQVSLVVALAVVVALNGQA
ncbi:hypothetical protein NBRC10513v2_005348 [Rhodotorula toruloides]